jgi:hypothetical protein
MQYNAGFAALQQFFSTFCLSTNILLKQLLKNLTTAETGSRDQHMRRVRRKNQPKT